MRKVVFSAALLVLTLGLAAVAADVSGTWAVRMRGPMGYEDFDMVIKVSGESLIVTANHPMFQELAGKFSVGIQKKLGQVYSPVLP